MLLPVGGEVTRILKTIFVSIKLDVSISSLVRDIKVNSSKWINDKKLVAGKFQRLEGFGGFSYGQSQLDQVIQYINNQENHLKKKTFKEECLELLRKFNVDFDNQNIFDWFE